jgi:hypothetical protein
MYEQRAVHIHETFSPHAMAPQCPHKKPASIFCSAAVMSTAISERQNANYCCTENYDHCPLFLAQMPRASRMPSWS